MAFVLSDRIKETTTTTGTGTYTLGGATTGFETFTANLSNGDTTYYCCTDGTDFEVGLGTFTSSGTTLARTTILSSSNSNNAVSWSSGTRNIFCTLPGTKVVSQDGNGNVGIGTSNPQQKLHIAYSSNNTNLNNFAGDNNNLTSGLRVNNTNSTTNSYASIDLRAANADVRLASVYTGTTNKSDFVILVDKEGNTGLDEAVRVTSTSDVIITNTDTDAIEDPSLILYRNSSSPAVDDELGEIVFRGRNDNSENIDYVKVYTEIKDETDGTESGALKFEVMKDGTLASWMTFSGEANQTYVNKKFNMQNNNITNIGNLTFEGSTSDTNETTLTVTDPTADRTITLPNAGGNVQLNQGSGETNGTFENFQQDYQSSSYFVAGEYIEVATISHTNNSSNYNFVGTIMAQISQNIQVLDIKVGVRYSSSGNISREIGYISHQIGDDYVEPVLWSNTSTNTTKLVIKGKTGTVHKVGVNLTFFQRGDYDDITWNTTAVQDTTSIPSGYTEYTGEKVASFITHGAVELYHNNIKKLETTSTGVTVTGLLSATTKSFDIEHPTKPKMRLRYGSLEGPENGVYVRGRLKNRHVINLPDYWTGLVHEDSITVNLTPIGNHQGLYIESIENNMVFVGGENNDKIHCFYTVYGERKDVEKLEVEYES